MSYNPQNQTISNQIINALNNIDQCYDSLKEYEDYAFAMNNGAFVYYALIQTIDYLSKNNYKKIFNKLSEKRREKLYRKAMEILFGANFSSEGELTNKNEVSSNIYRTNYTVNGRSDCLILLCKQDIIDRKESMDNDELNIKRKNPTEYQDRHTINSIMYNNDWINRKEATESYTNVTNRVPISHFSASQKLTNKINSKLKKSQDAIKWDKNGTPIVKKDSFLKKINNYIAMKKNKDIASIFASKVFQVYNILLEKEREVITYEKSLDLFIASMNIVYNDNKKKYNIRIINKLIKDHILEIDYIKKNIKYSQNSTKFLTHKKAKEFKNNAKAIKYENVTKNNSEKSKSTEDTQENQNKTNDKNKKFETKGETILERATKKINGEDEIEDEIEDTESENSVEDENNEQKTDEGIKPKIIPALFATSTILNKIKLMFCNMFKYIFVSKKMNLEHAKAALDQYNNANEEELSYSDY